MRLDHIAFRVADREQAAKFWIEAFGYKIQTTFEPKFSDGTSQGVKCIALEPPEKIPEGEIVPPFICWAQPIVLLGGDYDYHFNKDVQYHMAPEIFISDGPPESIVGKWVDERNGVGGIHHMAYQVKSVQETMDLWMEKGWADFLSNKPLTCPGLTQVFTKPNHLGVIFEFIEREKHGFCEDNVGALMESTKDVDGS